MRRSNCDNDVTDVPRLRARRPVRVGADLPPRAREGNLVEIEMIEGQPQQGVVISVTGGDWEVPWYEILFNDGTRRLMKTRKLRVLSRRRRPKRV